jgi:hypothetical protein
MGHQTNNQKAKDLRTQILEEKYKRVGEEMKAIFDREGVAFQAYLHYSEGGIVPMVRLVERKQEQSNGNSEAEKSAK